APLVAAAPIASASTAPASLVAAAPEPAPVVAAPAIQPAATAGTLVDQVLERPLRPGEVSLDELERAFRETAIETAPAPVAKVAAPAPALEAAAEPRAAKEAAKEAKAKPARRAAAAPEADVQEADKIANQSIRVNVDT